MFRVLTSQVCYPIQTHNLVVKVPHLVAANLADTESVHPHVYEYVYITYCG